MRRPYALPSYVFACSCLPIGGPLYEDSSASDYLTRRASPSPGCPQASAQMRNRLEHVRCVDPLSDFYTEYTPLDGRPVPAPWPASAFLGYDDVIEVESDYGAALLGNSTYDSVNERAQGAATPAAAQAPFFVLEECTWDEELGANLATLPKQEHDCQIYLITKTILGIQQELSNRNVLISVAACRELPRSL